MGDANLTTGANFFFAGLAGAAARAAVHGPSVVKIRQEAGVVGARTGPWRAFLSLRSTNGMWGFVAGEGTAVVRAFPHYGIALALNQRLNGVYYDKKAAPMAISNLVAKFACGAVGGIAATLVTHPLDVVKTRLIVHHGVYRGPLDAFMRTLRTEGVYRGIYRGFAFSLVGAAVFWGSALTGLHVTEQFDWVNRKPYFPLEWLVWPTAAVLGAGYISLPFDVIRRKYMSAVLPKQGGGEIAFRNLNELLVAMWKYNGPYAWFQGAGANMLKMAPQFVIFLAVYKGKDLVLNVQSVA